MKKAETIDVNLYYKDFQALKNINFLPARLCGLFSPLH